MRRAWNVHGQQQQIFAPSSDSMKTLQSLNGELELACGDPARFIGADYKKPTRRQQLVSLRNELRTSLATVETKLEEAKNAVPEQDPKLVAAIAQAKERMKMPVHLRGSPLLNSFGKD